MRAVLVAINAKYIHSNLAVYSLKAAAGAYEAQVELAEYTINHQLDEIFASIYHKNPTHLFLSCYIWNRREVLLVADYIKKVLPETIIWAGGPEVSYDAVTFLEEYQQFDGVMVGEGEETFRRLLHYYDENNSKCVEKTDGKREENAVTLEEIPGIVYRSPEAPDVLQTAGDWQKTEPDGTSEGLRSARRRIVMNPPVKPTHDLDALPFVYQEPQPQMQDEVHDAQRLHQFENRILYYETSRGCPFSCSYCLSSIDKRVRFRSLELVKRELQFFLDKRVPQVKFVDRTFNCSHSHATAIWKYITEHDNGITNFHFEIAADLLNEEELTLLSVMRPGLVQLEIGVQTVNDAALAAIHRTARFEEICAKVNRISEFHNIHQHLDLIAGLPYEDFESFRTSFDAVYRLHPQELQLGFLKVLKGSEMYERAAEYGIVYRGEPPYEVLQSRWISCGELLRLKEIEEMVEVYYNSQQFRNTIAAAETRFDRPIALYEALADYYKEQGLNGKSYSRTQRMELLRSFLQEHSGLLQQELDELLLLDLYLRENAKSRPQWAPDLSVYREAMVRFYQDEVQVSRVAPGLLGMNWKQRMRMTHLEQRNGKWQLFVYDQRDPLTYDARICEVELG